ncbi:TonB-dependent receptor [Sediminibacterium sp.]|uniref:TonB-dependent receptor n=1 Tax=Sediminibacterium sp. TaxID=1917865 RepID=UPI002734D273|nr:TonB-dependent receptor [Sediminibacterium sp.]MDP3393684.1 TonB-dependent receptor [Sediminibacterium sp.]MDP3566543.1 TonB-dependent receptor [Sediminibacterium sp.]
MRKWYLLAFLLHWVLVGLGQEKVTLNGYIKDGLSGETLIGANIVVKGSGKTVTSNNFGFFSITLTKGKYQLTCSYIGYQTKELDLDLINNTEQLIQLLPNSAIVLQDVTVSARRRDNNVKTAQMGKMELSVNTAKALPAFLGEVDILKTLQLMPGVRNAGEGNAGFYVRGGGPDQNLILLDDAVVYNTGHLFGFFSVFNSDAIKNVSLIKGGMPAQYGGRLSSVVDIAMKEGNNNKTQVDAGIGLIASRFSIQGPIKSKKSSFIVSARRTYIDAITKPLISKSSDFYGSGYYFYDLNAKMNFQISEKDHLYISGYFGRDKFNFNNAARSFKTLIDWGNATSTVRWNHVFNKKLFSNTTLVYNDYHFNLNGAQNDFNINLSSGIRDLTAKTDFDYYASPEHKLKFGVQFTHHTFLPNIVSGNQDSVVFTPNNASKKFAREWAVYLQDDWEINSKLKLNLGLRYSLFQQTGKYTNYTRDNNGNKLDSTVYGSGQIVQQYGGLEPRATLRYTLDETSSLKAGVTRNLQYIHLVTNAGSSLPTDLWVPSTLRVKPQLSWQYAAGYFKNFNNGMFETSLEVYYKTMENQIEYREGYTPSLKDPEEEFVFGRGWSYGAEFFINKVKGRLTGWIGYTLGWTWRKFPDLNQGQKYPSRYDRRHDLSVVANYTINDKWKIAGVFVYGTGNAISVPERFYFIGGVLSQQYSGINAYRMRAYHRMDIAATYTPKPKKERKYTTNWVFSLYNAYSRANPYFLYFDQEGSAANGTLNVSAKQVSLFPVLPSVTWNLKF